MDLYKEHILRAQKAYEQKNYAAALAETTEAIKALRKIIKLSTNISQET